MGSRMEWTLRCGFMEDDNLMIETGWLLDNGTLCIGASWCGTGFELMPYTHAHVLRFAREIDAQNFKHALTMSTYRDMLHTCKPVEHSWS
jgi:hypothetical protein